MENVVFLELIRRDYKVYIGKIGETEVDFVAEKLAEHYLCEEGKYYNGKTVAGVNVCYNGNSFWEEKIAGIMAMISKKCGKPKEPEEKEFSSVMVFSLG